MQREQYEHEMYYLVYQVDETMDVRNMEYEDGSFDMVIDKATFDSVICGENSTKNIEKMLTEIHRVLKDDGVYVMVSYVSSDHRLPCL